MLTDGHTRRQFQVGSLKEDMRQQRQEAWRRRPAFGGRGWLPTRTAPLHLCKTVKVSIYNLTDHHSTVILQTT